MVYRLAYSLILQRHFLNWDSLLSDDYILGQISIKLGRTEGKNCNIPEIHRLLRLQNIIVEKQ